MSDLIERCKEILTWQRTGVLPGNALRELAKAKCDGDLRRAESATATEAFGVLVAQPAQAVMAKRVPMTDQEILDAAEAIKTKRIEAAKQAVLDRKGSKCSRCGGVLGVDHNGYHMFNRCESCLHVPMFMSDGSEFLPPPGIVGEKGGA